MIETKRLILRNWEEKDKEPFAKLNVDPEVMKHFPRVLPRDVSDNMVDKLKEIYQQHGYTFYAVELKATGELIGLTGVTPVEKCDTPNTPFNEIGWRFARAHWRQGYAFEAASACLQHAFIQLSLDAVYSLTALINEPSWRLMEKLGMQNTNQDFDMSHPQLVEGSELTRHCLYKIEAGEYLNNQS